MKVICETELFFRLILHSLEKNHLILKLSKTDCDDPTFKPADEDGGLDYKKDLTSSASITILSYASIIEIIIYEKLLRFNVTSEFQLTREITSPHA